MSIGPSSLAALLAISASLPTAAASHPEVLVVYNANSPGSLAVAQYYISKRSIPAANLCAISPPATDIISLSDYNTSVKAPVQACLNDLGARSILYIVFSYLTPYDISSAPPYTAAVDSYVADIWNAYQTNPWTYGPTHTHGYYGDSQNQGNVYAAFQTFAQYRASANATTIYSVWRLDGASAAIAEGLVDLAMQAEAQGGPSGQGCFDLQYGPAPPQPDWSANSGDWDLHAAAVMMQQVGFPVTEDDNPQEFGTAPVPLTCPGHGVLQRLVLLQQLQQRLHMADRRHRLASGQRFGAQPARRHELVGECLAAGHHSRFRFRRGAVPARIGPPRRRVSRSAWKAHLSETRSCTTLAG